MATTVEGQCRVCLSASATEEEHVWPAGYLKRLDKIAPPPMAWTSNGQPLLKPNGKPFVQQEQRQRMFLPVCRSCNAKMERFIEAPAQALVVDLVVNRWTGELTAAQWSAVGRWWMKVLLMTGHEDVRMGDQGLDGAKPFAQTRFRAPMPDLTWLTTDGPAPADASLYVFRADPDLPHDTAHRLVFPHSVELEDGSVELCHHINLATVGIAFMAVWHPGISIVHPLVEAGDAWELLHAPPAGPVAIAALPKFSHQRIAAIAGDGRVSEGHQVGDNQYSNLVAGLGSGPDNVVQVFPNEEPLTDKPLDQA